MRRNPCKKLGADGCHVTLPVLISAHFGAARSEEHTSELQPQSNLVCRLLLEKKKTFLRQPTKMTHIRCRSSDTTSNIPGSTATITTTIPLTLRPLLN